MARVTNLNTFRKQKARAQKRARGDANAVRFGRTRAQKDLERAQKQALDRHLDAHKGEKRDEAD